MANTTSPLALHIVHHRLDSVPTVHLYDFFLMDLHEIVVEVEINLQWSWAY